MAHPSPANANTGPTRVRGQVRIITATVILPITPVEDVDLADLVDLPEPAARILLKVSAGSTLSRTRTTSA
jgi:hypothetical protein